MKKGRRNFPAKFKAKVALEALKVSRDLPGLALQHGLTTAQVRQWKRELLAGAELAFEHGHPTYEGKAERDHLLKIIVQLKAENDFLKKNLK